MLEMDYGSIAFIAVLSALISALIAYNVVQLVVRGREIRVTAVEASIVSLQNSIAGQKSAIAKNERKERQSLALAEAAALIQTGKPEELKSLAAKYPDVLMDLVKNGL